ncbi:hypothetical protein BBP40_003282 [Aspergillus hancockii]|nr:hypothetical protein BBP40_003282 [Aspergillus hancockii]
MSLQVLRHAPAESIRPALSCRPFEFSIIDMELFHHFLTDLDFMGSSENETQLAVWRTYLSRLGFSFPYILRLLLASAGFHLARYPGAAQRRQCSIQEKKYRMAAERQYNLAIGEVSAAMPRLDKENCHAVFTAATHIFVCSFAKGPRVGEYLAFRDDANQGFLSLFMGVRTVRETCVTMFPPDAVFGHVEDAPGSSSQPGEEKGTPIQRQTIGPEYHHWLEQLQHLTAAEWGTNDPRCRTYHGVIDELRRCYEAIYNLNPPLPSLELWPYIFGWLYRLPDIFMVGLYRRHQPTLAIFSYFVILLKELDSSWFITEWPEHILAGVNHHLDDYYRQYIRWPINQMKENKPSFSTGVALSE